MINKKLLSFDRGALRYVGLNVLFQWLGMLCNVVFVTAVARLVGFAFDGSLTAALLWQNLLLCLCTVPLRFGFTEPQRVRPTRRFCRSGAASVAFCEAKCGRAVQRGEHYVRTAALAKVGEEAGITKAAG